MKVRAISRSKRAIAVWTARNPSVSACKVMMELSTRAGSLVRACLSNEGETFFNHIAAPGILGVVKAPDGLWARFLELLERGPLLQ